MGAKLPQRTGGGIAFVPVPLARVGDEAAHLVMMLGSMRHERELMGGMEPCQATRRGHLLEHLRPVIVGKDSLDKVLAEGHVVEAAFFLQRLPLSLRCL